MTPHSDLPRRVGSPAHTRSILKDFSTEWKRRERLRLQAELDAKLLEAEAFFEDEDA